MAVVGEFTFEARRESLPKGGGMMVGSDTHRRVCISRPAFMPGTKKTATVAVAVFIRTR
jgi:hypothetical protein